MSGPQDQYLLGLTCRGLFNLTSWRLISPISGTLLTEDILHSRTLGHYHPGPLLHWAGGAGGLLLGQEVVEELDQLVSDQAFVLVFCKSFQ